MSDDPQITATEPHDASLGDDLRQLVEDARAFAEAELAWQKARAAYAGRAAAGIALFGALAAAFALFVLVAVTVGLLLALTPTLGAWGALVAVGGGLLLAALLCGAAAALRLRRTVRLIADRPEDR